MTMVRMWRQAADAIVAAARSWIVLVAVAATVPCVAASGDAATSPISMPVHAHTGIRLMDVVWTGKRFLYVENTTNVVWASWHGSAAGLPSGADRRAHHG